MSELVKLIINNKEMEAQNGSLLIDKLLDENINIPHFCYHRALGKDGNCRMCMVEIKGQKRPQISCNTLIKEGMIIDTTSEMIVQVRKSILELELINHPIDCPTCDQAGECKLQEYYMESGFYDSRIEAAGKVNAKKRTDLGSNVMLDQERCVLCTRCVRFCSDVTKTNELGVLSRGDHSVIDIFPGRPLNNPYAMNVVDLCPVGALTSKDFRFKQRVWFMDSFSAICNGCSKACNIIVDHRKEKYKDDVIFRFRPRVNEEVNGYFICDYGRLSYKKESENRFETARIKNIECDEQLAIQEALKDITRSQNTLFLIGPNLSYEEMLNVKIFCKAINANLSGYSSSYIDESFGDDFLKNNDKSTNRASLNALEINTKEDYFNESLEKALLVVVLDNEYFNDKINILDNKSLISVFSHNNETINKSKIAIPMASFYEKTGMYINEDLVKQKVVSQIQRNSPLKSISEILQAFQTNLNEGAL